MKSKRNIVVVIILTAVTVCLATIFMFGPDVVEDEIETRLVEKIESKGMKADWSSFEARYVGEFVMRGLTLEAPTFGTTLTADHVEVSLSFEALLGGDVRLQGATLSGIDLTIDVPTLRDSLRKPARDEDDGVVAPTSSPSLVSRLLDSPPPVDLHDARITLTRGAARLIEASAPAAKFRPGDGAITVETAGKGKLVHEGLPAFLRQSRDWQLSARFSPQTGDYGFSLRSPEEAALIDLSQSGVFTLQVGSLDGRGNIGDRTVGGELRETRLRVGDAERPAVDLTMKRFLFDTDLDDRDISVHAIDPSLYLTPSKFGAIRPAVTWGRALAGISTPSAPDDHASPSKESPRTRAAQLLVDLLVRTDVTITRMEAGIELQEEDGSYRSLTLLERFDAEALDGRVLVHGQTAGGTFSAEAQFVPGDILPDYAALRALDVNLDDIPGMPEGRTGLPSRGTSGKLGGVVDLRAAVDIPPMGLDGPLLQPPATGYLSVSWHDGVIDLTGVSDEPLEEIDAAGELSFRWHPVTSDLDVFDATFEYGPIVVDATFEGRDLMLDPTFELEAEMDEVDCQRAIRSMPDGLLGPYRAIELEGIARPSMSAHLSVYQPRSLRLKIEALTDPEPEEELCKITALNARKVARPDLQIVEDPPTGPHLHAQPLPEDREAGKYDDVYWLNLPFIERVEEGISEEAEVYVGPGTKSYVPLHELPGYVGGAAYLSEEMLFYEDPAISIGLIAKALRLNLEKGRFVYGGSTVTQQLVKNLFLSRDKTLSRKFQEALISWRVTDVVSKDRVLELYLNCIEYGPDIYGIGPAAEFYFDKDARQLTAKEAIFLAMLKPAPWYGPKAIRRGETSDRGWWADRYEELYQRLIDKGYLTKEQAEAERPYILRWNEEGEYEDPNAMPEVLRLTDPSPGDARKTLESPME